MPAVRIPASAFKYNFQFSLSKTIGNAKNWHLKCQKVFENAKKWCKIPKSGIKSGKFLKYFLLFNFSLLGQGHKTRRKELCRLRNKKGIFCWRSALYNLI